MILSFEEGPSGVFLHATAMIDVNIGDDVQLVVRRAHAQDGVLRYGRKAIALEHGHLKSGLGSSWGMAGFNPRRGRREAQTISPLTKRALPTLRWRRAAVDDVWIPRLHRAATNGRTKPRGTEGWSNA